MKVQRPSIRMMSTAFYNINRRTLQTSKHLVYRRNKNIRGPIEEFGWINEDGLKILSPVIQLFYKSRGSRDKDLQDLKNCLQVFSEAQKERLKSLLLEDSGPTHPWIALI